MLIKCEEHIWDEYYQYINSSINKNNYDEDYSLNSDSDHDISSENDNIIDENVFSYSSDENNCSNKKFIRSKSL